MRLHCSFNPRQLLDNISKSRGSVCLANTRSKGIDTLKNPLTTSGLSSLALQWSTTISSTSVVIFKTRTDVSICQWVRMGATKGVALACTQQVDISVLQRTVVFLDCF